MASLVGWRFSTVSRIAAIYTCSSHVPVLVDKVRSLGFHTTSSNNKSVIQKWPTYNTILFPPQKIEEPRRPAQIFHVRHQIKYSKDKMWYIACMIRGLSIDAALTQLSFCPKKGAKIVKEILLEAQELAVQEHNVEYKSNLWIAESFVSKGTYVKGLRRHARKRYGEINYVYCHYFVMLQEGQPPKHYYSPPATTNELIKEYISDKRKRTIIFGL